MPAKVPGIGPRLCLTIASWNSQALFKARETLLLPRMQPGCFRPPDYQTEPSTPAGLNQIVAADPCAARNDSGNGLLSPRIQPDPGPTTFAGGICFQAFRGIGETLDRIKKNAH